MTTTPEGRVKNKVKMLLKQYPDVYWVMPRGTTLGRTGVPDFLMSVKGTFVGLECKARPNKPTARQEYELECIRKSGGAALWVDETTLPEFEALLCTLSGKTS